MTSAASSVGWRVCSVHSWLLVACGSSTRREQLVRPDDALRVRRRGCSGPAGARRAARPRSRAAIRLAERGVHGRPRSRSASAARRYRPVPPTTIGRRCWASSPSISSWARRAKAPRRVRLVDGHEAEQPVFELRLLERVGGPGEDRQALVDLHRVGGDRDRVLSTLTQALGERDGDGGLADTGRPEDGDDLHGRAVSSPRHARPHRHRPFDRRPSRARPRWTRRRGAAPSSVTSAATSWSCSPPAAARRRPSRCWRPCTRSCARRADRVRRGRRDRPRAGDRGRHRGVGLGRLAGRRHGADVPRRRRGARGRAPAR